MEPSLEFLECQRCLVPQRLIEKVPISRVFECATHGRGRQESPHLSNEFTPHLGLCRQCLQSLLNELSKLMM